MNTRTATETETARGPRTHPANSTRTTRKPRTPRVPRTARENRTARTPHRDTGARTARGAIGRHGENIAARHLTETGMTVLARNWRCGRTGEIDIVAQDGDILVVCEVKTRRGGRYQHPMASVTPRKTHRLRDLAQRWTQTHGGAPPGGVRIDLVGVVLPARGAALVEHARGVA